MAGEAGFAAVRRNGISLGNAALDATKRIACVDRMPTVIHAKESVLTFAFREDATKTAESGVMAVLINDDMALAVIPYEPFVQHQIDLIARSPVKNTFVLGYAFFGKGVWLDTYLPTVQAVSEGGYGAALGSFNALEVGAGERMVNDAVASISCLLAEKVRG